jgi:hypothetical protein
MIKPTIGRVVWYWPKNYPGDQQFAAIVCYVWSDELVNLSVFDSNGNQFGLASVKLYQGEGEKPTEDFAEWMPYQVGQAKAAISAV